MLAVEIEAAGPIAPRAVGLYHWWLLIDGLRDPYRLVVPRTLCYTSTSGLT